MVSLAARKMCPVCLVKTAELVSGRFGLLKTSSSTGQARLVLEVRVYRCPRCGRYQLFEPAEG